jgi:hypothetical protein
MAPQNLDRVRRESLAILTPQCLSDESLNHMNHLCFKSGGPDSEGPPMWTNENRGRYDRSRLRYPSDLTDDECGIGVIPGGLLRPTPETPCGPQPLECSHIRETNRYETDRDR